MAEILGPSSRKRKLAAILHADVVGFSRLMGEDEAATHEALGKLRHAVDPLITAHAGRIVGTAGDSLLADFSSVVDALSCAVEMQRAALAINEPIPPQRRLELRIGVNLGDVIVDGDDIFGDGVNIAARLEALAQPGTICISHTVYDQVRNKLDLDYRPLGSHRVKNIAEPIRAYAVGPPQPARKRRPALRRPALAAIAGITALVAAGLVAWALHAGVGRELLTLATARHAPEVTALASPDRLSGRPMVAVLPFKNLSDDSGQDYFSDGIAEDVIAALGRFSNLLVAAKSASFQFKGRNVPPAEIGRLLNARYLLEGSVRRSGDRVRVNVELTEAETGRHLWSEGYDRSAADLFAVKDEIARCVDNRLKVTHSEFPRQPIIRKHTQNPRAYQCYLKGRFYWTRRFHGGLKAALEQFEKAIQEDAGYALASYKAGANRWSFRFDRFATTDRDHAPLVETNTEHGRAWAITYLRDLSPHIRLSAEFLQITGDRIAAAESGFDPNLDARSVTVEVRYGF